VQVFCAGRTDAGVHALGQVVSFQTENSIPIDRVPWVTNRYLPPSIIVRRCREATGFFHARFSAAYRRYWYVVQTRGGLDPIAGRFRWQIGSPLRTDDIEIALRAIVGTHDFVAFCHREGRAASTIRTIYHAQIRPWSNGVILDIQADAFVHRMIRLLVANIVAIGRGIKPISWLEELLYSRDRHLAGQEAPSCGLFLMRIGYPPTVNPRWGSILEKLNHEELLG